MNKSALRTFATSARKELLKKVEAKAMKIGITEDNIKKAEIESSDAIFIDGKQLSKEEKIQRDKLITRINQIGFKQVMEEVSYTWFNRFTALRFMEVNDYLPTGVRVLSSSNPNSADPDMLNEALELDLEVETDKELIYELKLNNKTEELFKYLIIRHCNDLNRYLPFMFETIDDYTEMLFPEGLLSKDSFIRQMTNIDLIPEDNWRKVEVIGWLYQYYIAEEKDRVIQAKKKYKTEEIPFATQLFTPDWIVQYMVQNSLGRYWVESHPEHQDLLSSWEFYLENPIPEPNIGEKLAPYINKELKVEDIKCFDPAMGSGHILVYMFDVFYEIYSKCGYIDREIPRLIIEHNLYGLDIDDRAYQLACFSVVMKAVEYNSRFFRSIEREGLNLNLASIQETNNLTDVDIAYIAGENSGGNFNYTKEFIEQFADAKTFGSLIEIKSYKNELLLNRLDFIKNNPPESIFEEESRTKVINLLPKLLKQADILYQRYNVLVTNPPFMGQKYMNDTLINFMKAKYPDAKSDTYIAFMEMCFNKVIKNGHLGFVTPFVWMFIGNYEGFRNYLISNKTISTLIQLEYNAFPGATVPVCTFTLRNYFEKLSGEYIKLSEFKGSENQPIKVLEAIQQPEVDFRYTYNSFESNKIPGKSIAYWASQNIMNIYERGETLDKYADTKIGLATNNNDRFLRFWFEVENSRMILDSQSRDDAEARNGKWYPFNKGGSYRKWYGNNEYVINWENDGYEIRNYRNADGSLKSRPQNLDYIFKKGLTWSRISSAKSSFRLHGNSFIFSDAGPCLFTDEKLFKQVFGFLNSKVANHVLSMINPSLTFQVGDVLKLCFTPIQKESTAQRVEQIVEANIEISKDDWDSYETSWGFRKHPLLRFTSSKISDSYMKYEKHTNNQFHQLKSNEEEINKIFSKEYDVENDVSFIIPNSDVTVGITNKEKSIKSFLSYFIGCIFGRYSLDSEGLIYAGGVFEKEKYQLFEVDNDNILPMLPGAYFKDDIISRFVQFVRETFGEENLGENLDFIAESLGKKKNETAKETIRRYFLSDFFKDHVQNYKSRPIYWLFTSGKQKAFNCLIYMHRYDKTTLSRIRTDYLHEYQIRLDAERKSLVSIIEGDSTAKEISNAKKELKVLDKKIEELKEYDEQLHHMADMQIDLDLDDGVKVNYEKFKGLVAKI